MASNLGIYFGIKGISIVNSKRDKIVNVIQIPHDKISGTDLEEKVPEDVKIVALIKDELRKQKIETKEVGVALSGKDFIIRSFEIPFLPSRELAGAINFEAKKYIPFKTEDLIFDFLLQPDKKEKKNLIIFLGIKKETMDNYLSIIKQMELKITSLEYAAFSVLRLTRLIKLKTKGVFALTEIDLEDETNFMILEEGFPLFSRDIDLSSLVGLDVDSRSDRLRGEIQLSLDYYYHRRFFSKHIERMTLIGSQDYEKIINTWGQEVGLSCQFLDTSQSITKDYQYSLSVLKAYSVSLKSLKNLPLRFELISNWERSKMGKVLPTAGELQKALPLKELLLQDARFMVFCVLIVVLVFAVGIYQRIPLANQLTKIIATRPKLITVLEDKSFDELKKIETNYKDKINTMNKLLAQFPYFTPELNALPNLLPKGVWLTDFRFQTEGGEKELLLTGLAYLGDRNKEFEAISALFSNLKNNSEFSKIFKKIEIVSIVYAQSYKWEVTNFAITCKD